MGEGESWSRWVSEARFAPFMREAADDESLAKALYAWHAEVAGAFFSTFHHFEVLVRNAIDEQLGQGQPQGPLRETWLMDFKVLEPKGIMQVIVAVERLDRGAEISRGRVVAGVSFGFWAGLFSKGYEELWRQQLRGAFVDGSLRRRDLTSSMRQLQTFRNRLAHHDCLLAQPLAERYEQMITIAGWIDPAAASWIAEQSRVPQLLCERPAAA